jgi:hypothetical protein
MEGMMWQQMRVIEMVSIAVALLMPQVAAVAHKDT